MKHRPPGATDLSRRRFVHGLALGGAVLGAGLVRPARGWETSSPISPASLAGSDFALHIAETPVNVTG